MHDVFIGYKREERDQAHKLAEAVKSAAWSVWWDKKLRAGEVFDDEIEKAICAARCVVVLWSTLSVASREVKTEANLALKLGKLVPVALDNAELPYRFQDLHTIQLQGWNGSKGVPAFQELVSEIAFKAGQPGARWEAGAPTTRVANVAFTQSSRSGHNGTGGHRRDHTRIECPGTAGLAL